MDMNVEDKMLHQIQTSLSNSIEENLFSTGRVYEVGKASDRALSKGLSSKGEKSLDVKDVDSESIAPTYPSMNLSRAEYIRQAREACLKQLNSMPQGVKNMEYTQEDQEQNAPLLPAKKRNKLMTLFPDVSEEDTAKEAASFNSLIIRTVCCLVIFLSIFVIDKLKVEWGDFTHLTVREFITSNDKLSALEDIIVSWLK